MNFILHIKCTTQQEFQYHNSFLATLRKEISADSLDMDNYSDSFLLDQAIVALDKADKCGVYFEIQDTSDTKPFIKIATWLADHPDKSIVFINGQDEWISKILFPQEGFCYHGLTEGQKIELIKQRF